MDPLDVSPGLVQRRGLRDSSDVTHSGLESGWCVVAACQNYNPLVSRQEALLTRVFDRLGPMHQVLRTEMVSRVGAASYAQGAHQIDIIHTEVAQTLVEGARHPLRVVPSVVNSTKSYAGSLGVTYGNFVVMNTSSRGKPDARKATPTYGSVAGV